MFSEELIEPLASAVAKALAEDPAVEFRSPDDVKAVVRKALRHSLAQERAIEEEAERMLRAHGAQILREGADFRKMLDNAKMVLAKQKGVVL